MNVSILPEFDPEILYRQRFHDLEALDYGQPFPGACLDLAQIQAASAEDAS